MEKEIINLSVFSYNQFNEKVNNSRPISVKKCSEVILKMIKKNNKSTIISTIKKKNSMEPVKNLLLEQGTLKEKVIQSIINTQINESQRNKRTKRKV